jgi:dTMP kinase
VTVPRSGDPAEARGAFITFEGGEGAGKSTQVARLAATLRARSGRGVCVTREPGGSPRAEAIRTALLDGVAKPYGPFAEALLFSAARIDHLDRLIRPALQRGETVLCDRFIDSTRAYQGAAGGLDAGLVQALERVVVGPTRPDLTLILDLPPEAGLARAAARGAGQGIGRGAGQGSGQGSGQGAGQKPDRFEAEALDFHVRLREAFLAIARAEPERCAVIDAAREPDAVEAAIRAAVAARLPALLPGADSRGDAA